MGRSLVALALALALAGCGEEAPAPAAPPPPPPRPPAPIVAARPIATRVAFDLVALPDGAALAWGVPVDLSGGVHAIALEPLGGPRGDEVVLTRRGTAAGTGSDEGPPLVEDVVATAVGSRVGVAWIVRRGARVLAQATVSSAGVEGFAPTLELGPSVPIPLDAPARGRLAAYVTPDATPVVAHRAEPGPCQASEGTCAMVRHTRFDGQELGGRGAPMEILTPCDPLIVGAVGTRDAFFHGTCHLDAQGAVATTVFALYPAIELASAPDVMPGCTPVAMGPGPEGAIVIARCESGLAATAVDREGRITRGVTSATPRARCQDGRPVIEIAGEGGPLAMTLTDPVSRIEGLLPESMAPAGSRAVWTGEAILIAAHTAREVRVRRYQCELAELVRTDIY